jgi:hypothetical protein
MLSSFNVIRSIAKNVLGRVIVVSLSISLLIGKQIDGGFNADESGTATGSIA